LVLLRLQDEAADRRGEAAGVDIRDRADAGSTQAEIGVSLSFVDWESGGDGFDLRDDVAGDDDICLEAVADRYGLVDQGNRHLAFERDARLAIRDQVIVGTSIRDGLDPCAGAPRLPDRLPVP